MILTNLLNYILIDLLFWSHSRARSSSNKMVSLTCARLRLLVFACALLVALVAGIESRKEQGAPRYLRPAAVQEGAAAEAAEAAAAVDPLAAATEPDNDNPLKKNPNNRVVHRVYDPNSGLFCELVGDCHVCPDSEKDQPYCSETGYQQELDCPGVATENAADPQAAATDTPLPRVIRYKACEPITKKNPFVHFAFFQVLNWIIVRMDMWTLLWLMALLLVLLCIIVVHGRHSRGVIPVPAPRAIQIPQLV